MIVSENPVEVKRKRLSENRSADNIPGMGFIIAEHRLSRCLSEQKTSVNFDFCSTDGSCAQIM